MSTPVLEAGQLRHLLTVEKKTESRDAHGGIAEAWKPDGQCWASVEPVSGEEFYRAQQAGAAITHRIRMRYDPNLTSTGHRIKFKGRTLRIESVVNVDERDIETRVMAREES